MNNIYKVIWSKVTNVLVVVSELARSKGVSGRNSTAASSNTVKVRTKLTALSVALSFCFGASSVFAADVNTPNVTATTSLTVGAAGAAGGSATGTTTLHGTATLNGKNLATTDDLVNKANQADLTALQNTVNGKASQTDLTALTNTVNGKANQSDLDALKTDFGNHKTTTDNEIDLLKKATDKLGLGTGTTYNGIKYFRANSTGTDAAATGTDAVAIGPEAKAAGNNTVALGMHASSYGTDSVTVGHGAAASGTASSSVVLGRNSQAGSKSSGELIYDGAQKYIIGDGKSGIAIGDTAKSRGNQNIAIGKNALTTNKDASETPTSDSIAIGTDAKTLAANSAIAFGKGAQVAVGGDSSIAMGEDAQSKDVASTAIGKGAKAEKAGLAVGTGAESKGAGSAAFGQGAQSTAPGSVAIGENAVAAPWRTISIGQNAGKGQAADLVGDKNEHINIGVEAGKDVDGQLNIGIGQSAGSNVKGKGNIALGQFAGKFIGGTNNSVGNNIAIGTNANAYNTPTDVVESIAIGLSAQAATRGVAVGKETKASGLDSTALGYGAEAKGSGSAAIGNNAVADGPDNVALGRSSVANTKAGTGYLTGTASNTVVSVGKSDLLRRVVNVADGSDDQDAVTVAQLKRVSDDVYNKVNSKINGLAGGGAGINYDAAARTPTENSITLAKDNKKTIIGNVAEGTKDDDAVNVQQLNKAVDANKTHYFSTKNAAVTGNFNNDGAKGEKSLAVGMDVHADGATSVAVGNNTTAEGLGSIAIGALYNGSAALDDNVAQTAVQTVAKSSTGQGFLYNTAIGAGSSTEGNNSVAIGSLARVSTKQQNISSPDRAVALGYYATASASKAIAIGERATSNEYQGTALGSQATATGSASTAIGAAAFVGAKGVNSIAMGTNQRVDGANSGSIGYAGKLDLATTGRNLGGTYDPNATLVKGDGTYSIGNTNSEILSNQSGVFGNDNFVQGKENIRVVGNSNIISKNNQTPAAGASAVPTSLKNVYVTGHGNKVDVGVAPLEDSKNIFVMGAGNIIGDSSTAKNITDTYVIGTGNKVSESNELTTTDDPSDPAATKTKIGKGYFILGNNVNATLQNSVYLGTESAFINAGAVSSGKDNYSQFNSAGFPAYQYAGGAPVGVVTIGNNDQTRRLQGVAAGLVGPQSTDAINGSQLYAHTRPFGFAADNTAGLNANNIDGLAVDDASITNMAKRAAGQALKLNGGATGALSDNNIGTVVNGTNQVDIKLAKELKNLTSAQFGDDNANTTVNSSGVTIKDGPSFTKTAINAAGNKITNVLAGDVNSTSTDAVNGSQLNEVKETAEKGWNLTTAGSTTKHNVKPGGDVDITGVNNITVANTEGRVTVGLNKDVDLTKTGSLTVGSTVVNDSGVTIANGPSMTGTGINAGDKKITNVKAGTDDTDAVNVAQLNEVKNAAATAGKGWTLSTGTGDKNKHVVKPETEVNISGDDNITVTHDVGNVKVALNKNLNLTKDGSVEIGSTTLNKDGLAVGTNVKVTDNGLTAGDVSVTTGGINAGDKKITNVADGTIAANSKDAVNGGQLHKVKTDLDTAVKAATTEVEAGKNVTVTSKKGDAQQTIYTVTAKDTSASVSGSTAVTVTKGATTENTDGNNVANVTDYAVDLSQATKDDIQKGVDAKTKVDTEGLTFVADNNSQTKARKLGETVGIKGGNNISTSATDDAVTVTLKDDISLTSVTTGDTKLNTNGVTITGGPSVTKTGIDVADKQITKLASGLTGGVKVTDATGDVLKNGVNVGDLKTVATDAFGLKDKAGNEVKQDLGTTAQITGDNNINTKVEEQQVNGKKTAKLTVSLNNNVILGGKDGAKDKDGKTVDGTLAVKSANDQNGVTLNGKDGSIDIDGADAKGKVTVAQGTADTADVEGKTKTRIVYDVDGSARELVATLNDGLKFGANSGDVYKAKLNNQVNIKGAATNTDWTKFDDGKNIMTQINGSTVTVGLAKDVSVNSVTATERVTVGDTTITTNGVTIEGGPSMTKTDGINANNMTIKNVAPGVNNTDAVNVGQLRAVEGKLHRVDRNLRAGVAGANAAASLPQAYLPGKNMVAVSAGTYRGEGAIALGVSRVSDNGKVVVKLTGNSDTRGNFGAGVGAGYQW